MSNILDSGNPFARATKHSPMGWWKLISRAGFRPILVRTVDFPVLHNDFLCRKLHRFGICAMIKAVAKLS